MPLSHVSHMEQWSRIWTLGSSQVIQGLLTTRGVPLVKLNYKVSHVALVGRETAVLPNVTSILLIDYLTWRFDKCVCVCVCVSVLVSLCVISRGLLSHGISPLR